MSRQVLAGTFILRLVCQVSLKTGCYYAIVIILAHNSNFWGTFNYTIYSIDRKSKNLQKMHNLT